jgi:hypothetical protein
MAIISDDENSLSRLAARPARCKRAAAAIGYNVSRKPAKTESPSFKKMEHRSIGVEDDR